MDKMGDEQIVSVRDQPPGSHELLLLLGAGSSMSPIPSVGDLTARLLDWRLVREPSSDVPLGFGGNVFWEHRDSDDLPRDGRTPLFAALQRIVATAYPNRRPDFEELIGLCEELGRILPLNGAPEFWRPPVSAFLRLVDDLQHFNGSPQRRSPIDTDVGTQLLGVAEEACWQVLSWVADACDEVAAPDKEPIAQGLRSLAENHILRVFSLNYDDQAFHSGLDFYTGFEDHGSGQPQEFRPAHPWPREKHMLLQLHGSVLFRMAPGGLLRRFTSRRDARTFGPLAPSSVGSMITGNGKAEKLLGQPYGTYHHMFREELLRCPRWLIIGYGFRDLHINRVLEQARTVHRAAGRVCRVVLVDYSAELRETGKVRLLSHDPDGAALSKKLMPVFSDAARYVIDTSIPTRASKGQLLAAGNDLLISLDGTKVALAEQLPQIIRFLGD
jgi:hypothetical protein